jgi:hypothetical protein
MAIAAFSVGALLLVTAATLLAASLRLDSATAFLLAAYLLAIAELVALAEVLSPFHAVTRPGYLGGTGAVAVVALGVWWGRGRPRPPSIPMAALRELRSHRLVIFLGAVVLLGLVYELAVGVTTPPNTWDSMRYHLARAAGWRQLHAVETIPNVNDNLGINASPPDAEMQMLFGLVLLGRDTFAAMPQFLAECALLTSVFGMARRVGFDFVPSVFAALLTATLSDVALQAVSTQNDLSVAAVIAAAVYFVLGRRRVDVTLAGLAIGLALGTKLYALLVLPAIALVAFAAGGIRRVLGVAAASVGGVVLFGAYVYVRTHSNANAVTSSIRSTPSGNGSVRAHPSAADVVSTALRVLYKFTDLSGLTHVVHPLGGLVVASAVGPALLIVVAAIPRARPSLESRSWIAAIVLAALVPAATVAVSLAGRALIAASHVPVNPPHATSTGRFTFAINTLSHEGVSYFGPLGSLLVLPLALGCSAAWIAGKLPRTRGALAAVLPIYVLALAATLAYTPYVGRYFIGPVAVTMPLAALVYGNRLLARTATLVGVVFLVLAHAFSFCKPVGLAGSTPIWSLSRADAQAVERPAMRRVLERAAAEIPQNAHVGLALQPPSWSYPFYGSTLGRTVTYLPQSGTRKAAAAAHVSWLIVRYPPTPAHPWRWTIQRVR